MSGGPWWHGLGRRIWWVLRGAAAGLAVLGILLGAAYLFQGAVYHPALAVREILVEGAQAVLREEIVRLSGVSPGDPLLVLDLARVQAGILAHPRVERVAVLRQVPGTLRIRVGERMPAAVLAAGGCFHLLDGEGVVLSVSRSPLPGFPILTGFAAAFGPGERVEEALPALRAVRSLVEAGALAQERISEARREAEGRVVISLTGTGAVLLMEGEGMESQAQRLRKLMEAGSFDEKAAGYDLRFSGRVVRLPDPAAEEIPGGSKRGKGGASPRRGGTAHGQG